MENYDYVVLIDENGQPYIAHSFKSRVSSGWGKVKGAGKRAYGAARTAGSKAHKYLLKVGQGVKAKYAYSPEEVDALLGRGKRAVKNAGEKISSGAKKAGAAVKRAGIKAADKLGVDDRIRANKTNEMFQNNKNTQTFIAKQDAKEAYEATPLGKAEGFLKRAGDIAKRYGSMTLGAIKTAPGRVKEAADKAADKFGTDEAKRLDEAFEAFKSAKTVGEARAAHDKIEKAKADYYATPAGKISAGIDSAIEKVAGAASRAGNAAKSAGRALTNAEKREAYNEAVANYNKVQGTGGEDEATAYWAMVAAENALKGSGVRGTAKSVASAAKTAAGKVKGAADTASEKITTAKAKSDLDKATRAYEKAKGTPNARQAYWDMMAAQQEYERVTGKKPPRSGKY